MLGVRRRDQRRPAGLRLSRRVAVLRRPRDRVPRPPEVPVVLVVPAVDRRVGSAEVLHRQGAGRCRRRPRPSRRASSARRSSSSRPACSATNGRCRSVGRPDRAVHRADRLDLVELRGPGRTGQVVRPARAELRGGLEDERASPRRPRAWDRGSAAPCRVVAATSARGRCSAPTARARSGRRPGVPRSSPRLRRSRRRSPVVLNGPSGSRPARPRTAWRASPAGSLVPGP